MNCVARILSNRSPDGHHRYDITGQAPSRSPVHIGPVTTPTGTTSTKCVNRYATLKAARSATIPPQLTPSNANRGNPNPVVTSPNHPP